jgi:hypothetical protein
VTEKIESHEASTCGNSGRASRQAIFEIML